MVALLGFLATTSRERRQVVGERCQLRGSRPLKEGTTTTTRFVGEITSSTTTREEPSTARALRLADLEDGLVAASAATTRIRIRINTPGTLTRREMGVGP